MRPAPSSVRRGGAEVGGGNGPSWAEALFGAGPGWGGPGSGSAPGGPALQRAPATGQAQPKALEFAEAELPVSGFLQLRSQVSMGSRGTTGHSPTGRSILLGSSFLL